MDNLTRRKVIAAATTIAVLTIAAVIMTKIIGAIVVAAFLAGAGTAITIGFVIIANIFIKQAGRKE